MYLGIEIGAENPGQLTKGITVSENILYLNDKAGLVFGGYDKKRGRVTGSAFLRNILWRNTNHRDAQGELWIQEAMDNRIEANTIVVVADDRGNPAFTDQIDRLVRLEPCI